MDRLDKMQIFVAVAETGSFTAAGERMGISNKVVSKSISALENDVGATLFFRTTRSMSITVDGQNYLQGCRRVLLEYEALSASLDTAQSLKGALRVTAPVTFGEVLVTRSVVDFLSNHPDIEVELVLSDHHEDLAEKGFDLAIRMGELKDSNLRVRHLGTAQLIVVAARSYLEAHGAPGLARDLMQHSCIRDTNSDVANRWPFVIDDVQTNIPVHGRLICNSSSACLDAARNGLGLAMVPDLFAEQDLVEGRLVRVLKDIPTPAVPIQGVYLPSAFQRPKLVAFVDHMKDAVTAAKERCGTAQA
ncbi:MAG: LysR family transcriptional regulator [Pseudomonadota bacterium]